MIKETADTVRIQLGYTRPEGTICCMFSRCPHGSLAPNCKPCRSERRRASNFNRRWQISEAREEIARQAARLTDPAKYEMERMRALARTAE